jgi:hypothetical protein
MTTLVPLSTVSECGQDAAVVSPLRHGRTALGTLRNVTNWHAEAQTQFATGRRKAPRRKRACPASSEPIVTDDLAMILLSFRDSA